MKQGALVLLHGGNPLWYSDLSGVELTFVRACLEEATRMDLENWKHRVKGIGVAAGNSVGQVLGKLFK